MRNFFEEQDSMVKLGNRFYCRFCGEKMSFITEAKDTFSAKCSNTSIEECTCDLSRQFAEQFDQYESICKNLDNLLRQNYPKNLIEIEIEIATAKIRASH